MKTVELTMSVDYVKHWDVLAGVREIVQNALDANRVLGNGIRITYQVEVNELDVETKGTVLDTKTLLLGVSEKGGENAIGKYGEGYKLGLLALLRSGKSAVIDTGRQIWRPRFVKSKTFGLPVLAFDISELRKKDWSDRILVSIGGITNDEWSEIQGMFLFTQSTRVSVTTKMFERYWSDRKYDGTVFFDSEQKGKVYVGGIFIMNVPELRYGYDLPPSYVELDRDRRTISSWELCALLSQLWQALFVDARNDQNDEMKDRFWKDLGDQVFDLKDVKDDSCVNGVFVREMYEEYSIRHGTSYPVCTMQESCRAEALGLKVAFVAPNIRSLLSKKYPTLEEKEKEKALTIVESWSIESLPPKEALLLQWAWDVVKKAGIELAKIGGTGLLEVSSPQASRFGSEKTIGCFIVDSGSIHVARSICEQGRKQTLIVTLVHEWAHRYVREHDLNLLYIEELLFELVLRNILNEESKIGQLGPVACEDRKADDDYDEVAF